MAEPREIPDSYYVYEFSFPEGMVDDDSKDISGVIFYVGKGKATARMDSHIKEAARGCECGKCEDIRSIWDAGLVVVRRIVFETTNEGTALMHEKSLIVQHDSDYLMNIQHALPPSDLETLLEGTDLRIEDMSEEMLQEFRRADRMAKQILDGVNEEILRDMVIEDIDRRTRNRQKPLTHESKAMLQQLANERSNH